MPTIPMRSYMRNRAFASISQQTLLPDAVITVMDFNGDGVAATRHRALKMVDTEWTAFLDDDDEFLPNHLEDLSRVAILSKADLVHSSFFIQHPYNTVLPQVHKFDPENPHWTASAITHLVRTRVARAVGGFLEEGVERGEDARFMMRIARAGYRIEFCDKRTWRYNQFHEDGPRS
jgi:hypothetical protein